MYDFIEILDNNFIKSFTQKEWIDIKDEVYKATSKHTYIPRGTIETYVDGDGDIRAKKNY